ncbi:aromatic acid exporter family protein [Neobacillus mesonae]|uniref:FUSC family protein n=1 Tax=Neobacillus mesonae TaxID=1193713 RepID=UPI00203C9B13|nr:FUSC family protein [Neobacillus mesonae]MCM3570243.1 aromatic acid exporter family protein [Neobacillus mesonae]
MKLNIFHRVGLTLHVLKSSLAGGVSWFAASWISHNQHPYFAALGAILTVQVTVANSIYKGTQRIIGIFGGVIVSIIVGKWLYPTPESIMLVVLIGMAFATALRLKPEAISQVAVSSILVLAFGNTPGYAIDRIIETMVGCLIAILLNIVFIPPNPIPDAERQILHLSKYACTVLKNLAIAYREQALRAIDIPYVQELVDETKKSYEAVQLAHQSLRYSPLLYNQRARVLALSEVIERFERITIQIRGIARGLVDIGRETQPNDHLIEAMISTASCIGLIASKEIFHSNELVKELQSLTKEAMTKQNICLLSFKEIESLELLRNLGSILTDLHRILVEADSGTQIVSREFEFEWTPVKS